MEREGKELKSRDKVVLKHSKEGLVEQNLSENKIKNISQKIEDVNLEKDLEDKNIESLDYSKTRKITESKRKKPRIFIRNEEYKELDMEVSEEKLTEETFILDESIIMYDREEDLGSESKTDTKMNHKKKYILTHKGRYKEKEESITQDLRFNKENLDISKDNIKEKLDFQKKIRAEPDDNTKIEINGSNKETTLDKKLIAERPIRTDKKEVNVTENSSEKNGNKSTKTKFKHHKEKPKDKLHHKDDKESTIRKAISSTGGLIGLGTSKIYHHKIDEVEDENAGTESIHKAQELGEKVIRKTSNYRVYRRNKKLMKEYNDFIKSKKNRDKLEFNKVLRKDNRYQETSGVSKYIQKWRLKRQYNKKTRKTIKQRFIDGVKGSPIVIKGIVKKSSKKAGAYLIALAFILLMIMVTVQSCSNILMGGIGAVAGTSYQASDKEVTSADVEYTRLETGLLLTLQDIEVDNSGYDEYRYDLDGVGHDPHELLAYLTVKYGDFKTSFIKGELQRIFEEQYDLSLQEIVETYTTTETFIDPETGESYEEDVEHEKLILLTKLRSRPLGEVLVERLDGDERELYDVLMISKGNFMTYTSPVDGDWKQYISSLFGWRIHPIHMVESFHTGLDIAKAEGETLYAIFDGVVKSVGYDGSGYGHYIVIEDKNGNTALYAHCSSINVSQGNTIEKGDTIANVGNTGSSTGAHLHLELEDSEGNLLNPYFYLYSEAGSTIGTGICYNGYRGNYGSPGIPYDNESIRALFDEADKHLGKRYIFGANGPNNFDCSSFVCWVFRKSGTYNIPRVTAQGIFNYSTPIPTSEAEAGDIIFFTGTYNAGVPVTHVGIYAGNGMMVHAGDPIQYTSIETNYWRNHFYYFGRLK